MIREPHAKPVSRDGIEQMVSRLMNAARAEAVFGHPVERGEVTVIPCSEVAVGFGVGGGTRAHPGEGLNKHDGDTGAGGGGGARSHPVAAIIIKGDKVSVRPIMDTTRVFQAVLAATGSALFWLARLSWAGGRGRPEPGFSPRRLRKMMRQGRPFRRRRRLSFLSMALANWPKR